VLQQERTGSKPIPTIAKYRSAHGKQGNFFDNTITLLLLLITLSNDVVYIYIYTYIVQCRSK